MGDGGLGLGVEGVVERGEVMVDEGVVVALYLSNGLHLFSQ